MKTVITLALAASAALFLADPCAEADKYQADYIKTQSAISFGLYTHNLALCFGTPSTVDMQSCRNAEAYRQSYLKTMRPSDLKKYSDELEYCMDKNKKR